MEEEKTEPKRKPAINYILILVQCVVMYTLYVTFYHCTEWKSSNFLLVNLFAIFYASISRF